MDIVAFVRIAITLTFLILAAGGPYAIIKLSKFIKQYKVAHEALQADHDALKVRVAELEKIREEPK